MNPDSSIGTVIHALEPPFQCPPSEITRRERRKGSKLRTCNKGVTGFRPLRLLQNLEPNYLMEPIKSVVPSLYRVVPSLYRRTEI